MTHDEAVKAVTAKEWGNLWQHMASTQKDDEKATVNQIIVAYLSLVRAPGYAAGAEAMRARAAHEAECEAARQATKRGGELHVGSAALARDADACEQNAFRIAAAIRALPLPEPPVDDHG